MSELTARLRLFSALAESSAQLSDAEALAEAIPGEAERIHAKLLQVARDHEALTQRDLLLPDTPGERRDFLERVLRRLAIPFEDLGELTDTDVEGLLIRLGEVGFLPA